MVRVPGWRGRAVGGRGGLGGRYAAPRTGRGRGAVGGRPVRLWEGTSRTAGGCLVGRREGTSRRAGGSVPGGRRPDVSRSRHPVRRAADVRGFGAADGRDRRDRLRGYRRAVAIAAGAAHGRFAPVAG
ncbi:hypothetical protein AB4Z54_56710, partial [Streptomyces sp. MCAF7]